MKDEAIATAEYRIEEQIEKRLQEKLQKLLKDKTMYTARLKLIEEKLSNIHKIREHCIWEVTDGECNIKLGLGDQKSGVTSITGSTWRHES